LNLNVRARVARANLDVRARVKCVNLNVRVRVARANLNTRVRLARAILRHCSSGLHPLRSEATRPILALCGLVVKNYYELQKAKGLL
jgi:hypothetical protein